LVGGSARTGPPSGENGVIASVDDCERTAPACGHATDFQLTGQPRLLRLTVREFAEREIAPHVMEWDEAQHFPFELVPTLAGRKGIRTKDRIIVDRATDAVSFHTTKAQDNVVVPFGEIDHIELRVEDRSQLDETRILFPVYIVKKDGRGIKVDEATNQKKMSELATKGAAVFRVPFRDATVADQLTT
jgi:hypothetical protein